MHQGAGVMNRNRILEVLSSLIVIVVVVLGWHFYELSVQAEENTKTYALSTYNINLDGFNYINSVVQDNYAYFLYQSDNYYILKEIDTLSNKEENYSYNLEATCHLQNENSYPYIYCTDDNSVSIYTVKFKNILTQSIKSNYNYALNTNGSLNFRIVDNNRSYEYLDGYYQKTNNTFVTLDTPYIKEAYCTDDCLLVKYNNLTEMTSLYKEDELLETNIVAYRTYENGLFTYNNDKIKIHNALSGDYKEFYSPINNLLNKVFTLGANDSYLYILDDSIISVYNLYDSEKFTNIDISKVEENINKITVASNMLYLYGEDILYVYNISEIESGNYNSSANYENNLINSKISYYQEMYNVTINLDDDPSYLSNNYDISPVTNYNDIINALEELDRYFIVFNKEFFSRFSNYGMSGLEIYLASNITSSSQNDYANADVVGLYIKKNNKYNIVIRLNTGEDITTIAYHETIHAIEDYLSSIGASFSAWNSLNPSGFTYSNVYYTNQTFSDTLGNNKYNNQIYFVDNYARSNELEDRARMFENICNGEDFSEYPHLSAKVKYIKKVLLNYFPELYSSSYFI